MVWINNEHFPLKAKKYPIWVLRVILGIPDDKELILIDHGAMTFVDGQPMVDIKGEERFITIGGPESA